MTKWLLPSLALSVSTVAIADPAQTPLTAQTGTSAPAANSSKPEKLICKSEEVLGSRLATHRTCLTATQWADRRLQDQQLVTKVQTSGYTTGK